MNTDRQAHILLVDDEVAIRRALGTTLRTFGFTTSEASRGEEALHLVRNEEFGAVLLDVQMPGIGGINTLVRLREMNPRLPILMLTVRDSEEDKVKALDLGADDYITKPFSMRECVARVRSAMRRAKAPEHPEDVPLQIGNLKVHPKKRTVSKDGEVIHLTRKEYDILYYLMSNAGRAVTHSKLLTSVWGAEYRDEINYLRTFMRALRKKVEDDPSSPKYLLTDPYVGYRFDDASLFPQVGSC